jgi:hypothetical protein
MSLTPDDERVFTLACVQLVATDHRKPYVDFDQLREAALALDMPKDNFDDALAALLNTHHFTDVISGIGRGAYAAQISPWAFNRYLTVHRTEEYLDARIRIVTALLTARSGRIELLAHELAIPGNIVSHYVHGLEREGHVDITSGRRTIVPKRTLSRVLSALQAEQ